MEHGRLRHDLEQVVFGQGAGAGHVAEERELLQHAGGLAVDEEVGDRFARQARAARQREGNETKSGRVGKAVEEFWGASRAREIEVGQGGEREDKRGEDGGGNGGYRAEAKAPQSWEDDGRLDRRSPSPTTAFLFFLITDQVYSDKIGERLDENRTDAATKVQGDEGLEGRVSSCKAQRSLGYTLVHLCGGSWRKESGPLHPLGSGSERGSSICVVDHVLDDRGKGVRRERRN